MGTVIKSLTAQEGKRVNLVISDQNWLETAAVDQLMQTANLPGIVFAAGMPDIHPGKGQPIGAAFISKNIIYPHLVGSDIGCGMAVFRLDIKKNKIKLDKWERQLDGLDGAWNGDIDARLNSAGLACAEQWITEETYKLGTIGGGNHFAELQAVNTIVDAELMSGLGLNKQSVVLLAHSGSRGLGQKILRKHVDHFAGSGLSLADSTNDNSAANEYIKRHNYAEAWATENRRLIADRFCECLNVRNTRLLDVAHNTVKPLPFKQAHALGLADLKTKKTNGYWIHRKGVSPTDNGLVMIPGSRGSLSYLVKPKDWHQHADDLSMAGFSLAHGAGRKWKRSDAKGRLQARFKYHELLSTTLGSRVICKNRDLIYEEAPQAYKNIDSVIADLIDAKLIDIVASFKPLITYKTRRQ